MKTDLFSDFPYTTAREWLDRITRDLRNKTPEAMHWSPDGLVDTDPYVHAEDVPESLPLLPAFGQWRIGESFEMVDPDVSNEMILHALAGGTECLEITCSARTEWKKLLGSVDLSLIRLVLNFRDDAEQGLTQFLAYAKSVQVQHPVCAVVTGAGMQQPAPVRFQVTASVHQKIVEGLTTTLTDTLRTAAWEPQTLSQYDLSFTIGTNYLVEIARLRAARILWQNLAEVLSFALSPDFSVFASTAPCAPDDDPYAHMIRSALMGTAAVLGGADTVFIQPARGGTHPEVFYGHIARNIHQILRYESKFTEIPDPVPGAYYLTKLTRTLVSQTWEALLAEIEKGGR